MAKQIRFKAMRFETSKDPTDSPQKTKRDCFGPTKLLKRARRWSAFVKVSNRRYLARKLGRNEENIQPLLPIDAG